MIKPSDVERGGPWETAPLKNQMPYGQLRAYADELEKQNADLMAALDVFFKVVVVDGQEYKPGLSLCAGCEELTIARGWECFYKPLTTECKYPDELQSTDKRAKIKEE
jgi:hypothetical protein